jgi:hypothetical protein
MNIEKITTELELIRSEIREIKTEKLPCPELRRDWIPRNEVMKFLGFGATQILEVAKKHNLLITRIGKRQFFSTQSLQRAFNESQIK